MFETLLIKAIRGASVTFDNPVNKSSLTYHSKFINEDSGSGGEEILLTAVVLYTVKQSKPFFYFFLF